MYLRDTDFPTLSDVATRLRPKGLQAWTGSSTEVSVLITEPEELDQKVEVESLDMGGIDIFEQADIARDHIEEKQRVGTIRLGHGNMERETILTKGGLQRLATFYEIPYKFLDRITPEEQQFILDNRIQRSADRPLTVRFDTTGVVEAYKFTESRIDPFQIAERLLEQDVMPEDAKVVEWWNTPDEFRLDVIVPEHYSDYIGGDYSVNDLTHGGLRIGQNRKQNLAPWVQPYAFRRVCTNGMEIPDEGMRVEARGAQADDILQLLMGECNRAFTRIMSDIKHFYDLRNEKIDEDRTGVFRRMAQEQGLADRTIGHMEDTLADALLHEGEPTMFDLLNHITNQANDPSMRQRRNARRRLERAGGGLIMDQAQRCGTCHARLNR